MFNLSRKILFTSGIRRLIEFNGTLPLIAIQFIVLMLLLTYCFYSPFLEYNEGCRFFERMHILQAYNKTRLYYFFCKTKRQELIKHFIHVENEYFTLEEFQKQLCYLMGKLYQFVS